MGNGGIVAIHCAYHYEVEFPLGKSPRARQGRVPSGVRGGANGGSRRLDDTRVLIGCGREPHHPSPLPRPESLGPPVERALPWSPKNSASRGKSMNKKVLAISLAVVRNTRAGKRGKECGSRNRCTDSCDSDFRALRSAGPDVEGTEWSGPAFGSRQF